MGEKIKLVADISAWGIIGAVFTEYLPPIAAGLAIIWHITQFYSLWRQQQKSRKNSKEN